MEARLREINEVLGAPEAPTAARPGPGRRGRRAGNPMSLREAIIQALAKGPMTRQELVKAVEDIGYVFNTDDPANSMGVILYGKKSPFKNDNGKFSLRSGSAAPATENNGRAAKKRTMSPEARARIAAAQRARWSKQKRAS